MFARESPDGWDTHGNEVEDGIDISFLKGEQNEE